MNANKPFQLSTTMRKQRPIVMIADCLRRYLAIGSANRPMNKTLPLRLSRRTNTKGWSARNLGGEAGVLQSIISLAVAAAASVPR